MIINIENMTVEEEFHQDVWWVLRVIKKELLSTPKEEEVKINIYDAYNDRNEPGPAYKDIWKRIRKIEEWGAFKIVAMYDPPYGEMIHDWENATVFLLAINQSVFDKIYLKYTKDFCPKKPKEKYKNINANKKEVSQKDKNDLIIKSPNKKAGEPSVLPKSFELKVQDRQIWINNYFLSKPHAVGNNFDFLEYIRSKPRNTRIKRNELPNAADWDLKNQVSNKGFTKILNSLGFKGELLKAYFPKRSIDELVYRGDKITQKELEKDGIKIPVLIKELELANEKNNPE